MAGVTIFVVQLLLASQAPPERVVGLLTLPEIFGAGGCEPFEPRPVPLYAEPRATREVGTIRVDKARAMLPNGGCDGLEVRVYRGSAAKELPTREIAYEYPAAIVVGERNGWFRIRLSDGAAWLAPARHHRFAPLAELFKEGLAATTDAFSGSLRAAPGGAAIGEPLTKYQDVEVLEVRRVREQYWLHVAVLSHSPCDANLNIEPFAIAKGWLPAHSDTGEPTVWFFSRGC